VGEPLSSFGRLLLARKAMSVAPQPGKHASEKSGDVLPQGNGDIAVGAPEPGSASARPKSEGLEAAPRLWTQTRSLISNSIDKLLDAIRSEYAQDSSEVIAEIENGLSKLRDVTARFDHTLAEAIQNAHNSTDEAQRKAELAKAEAIVTEHIKFVQSEPMIEHIDANPFGVQTNLKKLLTASLTHMAKVIR